MTYIATNKDGTSFSISSFFKKTPERAVIAVYPLISKITCVETGDVVWSRTIAYFPGDYDPGTKVLKGS